jgi:hypothetical protein
MTDADWLTCTNPVLMIEALRRHTSDRKLRLFTCARCRRHWDRLLDPRSRRAVEVAERYADGMATENEYRAAAEDAATAQERIYGTGLAHWLLAGEAANCCSERPPWNMARRAVERVDSPEREDLADLLRHFFPSPNAPPMVPPVVSPAVRELADSLYSGDRMAFVLHDALLDAGRPELAEHFRTPDHPRGCWALDSILEKS